MRAFILSSSVLGALLLVMAQAGPAQAQATRTWVSGVGDDANPCSRTAPCKTFAGAISKTAANGEINCIDPGGFGAVTITKSITIDCGGTFGSILASGTNGIIVSSLAPANVFVSIRNLAINGSGGAAGLTGLNGIRYLAGTGTLHLNNVKIFGFSQKGVDFQPSATAALVITDSLFEENDGASSGAVLIKPQAGANALASLHNVKMNANLFGVRAEDRSKVTVSNSIASANTNNGFLAVSTSQAAEINLIRSLSVNTGLNGVSVVGTLATIRLADTAILDNNTGILISGGTVASFTPATNQNAGNTTPGAPNASIPLQ